MAKKKGNIFKKILVGLFVIVFLLALGISAIAACIYYEVIEKEIRNGNKYLAGRFTVTLIGNKNFKAAFEIYLEQPNGEFLKIDGDSQIFPLSRLESSDADELLLKKEIVHEFDEPQQSFSDARIVNESASSSNEISLTELLQGHH